MSNSVHSGNGFRLAVRLMVRLTVFAAVYLLVLSPLINLYFDRVVMKNSLVRQSQRQFERMEELDILILGDSHSLLALNPYLLPDSYNYSSNGESYLQSYYKARKVLVPNALGVGVVIIPFDPHSFSSFRTERIKDILYWRRFLQFQGLCERLGVFKAAELMLDAWVFAYIGELRLTNATIDVLTGNRDMQKLHHGFLPSEGSFEEACPTEEEKLTFAQSRIQHHLLGSDTLDERLVRAFEDLVLLCSRQNITVIAVSFPISDQYLELAGPMVTRDEMLAVVRDSVLSDEYLYFFDYSRLFSGKPEYLTDSDHVNVQGSRILTRNLFKALCRLDLITI